MARILFIAAALAIFPLAGGALAQVNQGNITQCPPGGPGCPPANVNRPPPPTSAPGTGVLNPPPKQPELLPSGPKPPLKP